MFDPTASEWTWVGGSNIHGAKGVYGTQGTTAATNMPGARAGAVAWADSSGKVWLFGGSGMDSTATSGRLNDLWECNSP